MHRFTLRKKSRQIKCPDCGKRKFTPYYDVVTGVDIDPETVGRCSRENNCGYHLPPREFFEENPSLRPDDENIDYIEEIKEKREISLIKEDFVGPTLTPQKNKLTEFLYSLFPRKEVDETLEKYLIGYEGERIIFWQVDFEGEVRTGKKMRYHEDGKRDKFDMTLMHQEFYEEDTFELRECYFGEHLVAEFPDKEVRIVESEKTALICDLYFPGINWISTGGKHKWLEEEWYIFDNKKVILFPDEDAIEDWTSMKEDMLLQGLEVEIDNICEGQEATSDIADIIIKNFLDK